MPSQDPLNEPCVVVTGLGAVSAYGWGVEALRCGLRSGVTAIGVFDRFDHSQHRTHIAGQVPDAAQPLRGHTRHRLTVADRFAVSAADEAIRHAGLPGRLSDAGVFFATSTAGLFESEIFTERMTAGKRADLRLLASQQLNGPGDAVARHFGVQGPVESLSSACASGTLAIGAALRALRARSVEVAITGGADSLCRVTYTGFNALRAIDERPCRPFRADRAGMTIGEGAGVLVLETLDHARARGARPLAILAGAGASCDANHMTAPHPEGKGAALAIARALQDAHLVPDDVAFINAHGTGTPLNDAAEWQAIKTTFGARAERLPVTATKASTGHLLGAAGAIEAVATVLCLGALLLDPTPGDGVTDPALPICLISGKALPLSPGAAVSTSLAFGGANGALVLKRWEDS